MTSLTGSINILARVLGFIKEFPILITLSMVSGGARNFPTEGLFSQTGGYIFFIVRHGRPNFFQFSPTNV